MTKLHLPYDRPIVPIIMYDAQRPPRISTVEVPDELLMARDYVCAQIANMAGLYVGLNPARMFCYNVLVYNHWDNPDFDEVYRLVCGLILFRQRKGDLLDLRMAANENIYRVLSAYTAYLANNYPEVMKQMNIKQIEAIKQMTINFQDLKAMAMSGFNNLDPSKYAERAYDIISKCQNLYTLDSKALVEDCHYIHRYCFGGHYEQARAKIPPPIPDHRGHKSMHYTGHSQHPPLGQQTTILTPQTLEYGLPIPADMNSIRNEDGFDINYPDLGWFPTWHPKHHEWLQKRQARIDEINNRIAIENFQKYGTPLPPHLAHLAPQLRQQQPMNPAYRHRQDGTLYRDPSYTGLIKPMQQPPVQHHSDIAHQQQPMHHQQPQQQVIYGYQQPPVQQYQQPQPVIYGYQQPPVQQYQQPPVQQYQPAQQYYDAYGRPVAPVQPGMEMQQIQYMPNVPVQQILQVFPNGDRAIVMPNGQQVYQQRIGSPHLQSAISNRPVTFMQPTGGYQQTQTYQDPAACKQSSISKWNQPQQPPVEQYQPQQEPIVHRAINQPIRRKDTHFVETHESVVNEFIQKLDSELPFETPKPLAEAVDASRPYNSITVKAPAMDRKSHQISRFGGALVYDLLPKYQQVEQSVQKLMNEPAVPVKPEPPKPVEGQEHIEQPVVEIKDEEYMVLPDFKIAATAEDALMISEAVRLEHEKSEPNDKVFRNFCVSANVFMANSDLRLYFDTLKLAKTLETLGSEIRRLSNLKIDNLKTKTDLINALATVNNALTSRVNEFIKYRMGMDLNIDDFSADILDLRTYLNNNYGVQYARAIDVLEYDIINAINIEVPEDDLQYLKGRLTKEDGLFIQCMPSFVSCTHIDLSIDDLGFKLTYPLGTFINIDAEAQPMLFNIVTSLNKHKEEKQITTSDDFLITSDNVKYRIYNSVFATGAYGLVKV